MTVQQQQTAAREVLDRDAWTQCWLDDPAGTETVARYAVSCNVVGRLASAELHRIVKLRLGVDRSSWTLCVIDACRLGTVGIEQGRFVLHAARQPTRLRVRAGLDLQQPDDKWLAALQYWIERSGNVPDQSGPLIDGRQYSCKRALLRLRQATSVGEESLPVLPVAFARAIASGLITAS